MLSPKIAGSLFFSLLARTMCGQVIDQTASFRALDANTYIRVHYENDFFTATDYYYTQGINLEVVHPAFQKFFLNKLLISVGSHRQAGIAIEHNGYTPTSIEHNEILYGDRPFAAALMFNTFLISSQDSLHRRITSSLTLGVVGPAAGGRAMQSTIHQWVRDTQPLGWQNQIQNDVVINYEAGIEKSVVPGSGVILVNVFGKMRAGTMNTKLSAGIVMMVWAYWRARRAQPTIYGH